MSDSFNPINAADPFSIMPGSKEMNPFGGSGKGSSGAGGTVSGSSPIQNPPSLFDPYQKYIPQAMNSSQPVTDPSAILKAYQTNLPEFRLASQGNGQLPAISDSLGSRQQQQGK